MARFQARLDANAFERIVSRFLSPALAAAGQILSDAALAEDAVQETFLRLVRGREAYVATKPLASWFYAILRNVCTDMLRRRARQARLVREAALHGAAQPRRREADPSDSLDLLADLPKAARAVLTLRIVHNLSFRDVAAALGISEEAAKKRAQRALRRLREQASAARLCPPAHATGRAPGSREARAAAGLAE